MPPMRISSIGHGAGDRDFKESANVLRVLIGERTGAPESTTVSIIEANIYDSSPQVLGYALDRLIEAGALDVSLSPLQMKKNRPGLLVTILCDPTHVSRLTDLLFSETTTIGVRMHDVRRRTLARDFLTVETGFGEVRMKISRLNGSVLNATPEYDDCQRIATEKHLPLKDVLAAAIYSFQSQHKVAK